MNSIRFIGLGSIRCVRLSIKLLITAVTNNRICRLGNDVDRELGHTSASSGIYDAAILVLSRKITTK